MNELSAEMLATCLAEVRAGRLTIEECMALCPAIAEELRSLLEVAIAIPPLPSVAPDPVFRRQGRAALLQAIDTESKAVTTSPLRRLWGVTVGSWGQPTQTLVRRMGMPAVIIALVIALTTAAGGGAVFASQDALPGDALYQVKAMVEQVQVTWANGDEAKAQAYLDFAAKRVAEVQKASESGNADAAKLSGEAFVQDVTQAGEHLTKAAADGKDVSQLTARFEENLARHEKVLAAAREQAPEQAKEALASAAEAATNGLKVASSQIEAPGAVTRRDDDSTLPAVGVSAIGQLTPTVALTGTVSLTFTQTVSDVLKLADDPNVPGQSYNGLIAKLRSAQAALDRGQQEVAINVLDAFLNELNAMQRSGHISAGNYDALYANYTVLVTSLNGMPDAKKNEGHSKSQSSKAEAIPTATSVPTAPAVATPNTGPDQRGNSSKNVPPAMPTPRADPAPKGKK